MTDITEIMARAMCKADAYVDEDWRGWVINARAALAALEKEGWVVMPREPTEAMVEDDEAYIELRSLVVSLESAYEDLGRMLKRGRRALDLLNARREDSAMVAAGRKGT